MIGTRRPDIVEFVEVMRVSTKWGRESISIVAKLEVTGRIACFLRPKNRGRKISGGANAQCCAPRGRHQNFAAMSANSRSFVPSGLRPILFRGDLLNCRDLARLRMATVLGMYSVESRLPLFDPVFPTRWRSSSHLVTPVKGRVF